MCVCVGGFGLLLGVEWVYDLGRGWHSTNNL